MNSLLFVNMHDDWVSDHWVPEGLITIHYVCFQRGITMAAAVIVNFILFYDIMKGLTEQSCDVLNQLLISKNKVILLLFRLWERNKANEQKKIQLTKNSN